MRSDFGPWLRGAERSLVLGHRGARRDAPENTMLAFQCALDQGAQGVELDVRLAKDGTVIVLHDRNLARVTDQQDTRQAEDLSAADLRSTNLGEGQTVPTLDQVLGWAHDTSALVNIELKSDVLSRQALVDATVAVVNQSGCPKEQLLFSSFHIELLRGVARALPQIPRGWLFESAWQGLPWVAQAARAAALHPGHSLLSHNRIQRWLKRTPLLNTWTVNDPSVAQFLSKAGVNALISDTPGVILKAISGASF